MPTEAVPLYTADQLRAAIDAAVAEARARPDATKPAHAPPSCEQMARLLRACKAAMQESQRFYGAAGTNWENMISAIDDALLGSAVAEARPFVASVLSSATRAGGVGDGVAVSDELILSLLSEHTTFDLQDGEEPPLVEDNYGARRYASRFIDFARAVISEYERINGIARAACTHCGYVDGDEVLGDGITPAQGEQP